MTERDRNFLAALGAQEIRVEILRFARREERFFTVDVMRRFDLTANGARRHLDRLVGAGVLGRSRHREGAHRWSVCWTADPPAIDAIVDDLDLFLHDDDQD